MKKNAATSRDEMLMDPSFSTPGKLSAFQTLKVFSDSAPSNLAC